MGGLLGDVCIAMGWRWETYVVFGPDSVLGREFVFVILRVVCMDQYIYCRARCVIQSKNSL